MRASGARARRGRMMVCASVVGATPGDMASEARRAIRLGADLVELRLDALQTVDESDVHSELMEFFNRAVVTVRSNTEGGWFKGSEQERLRLISSVAAAGPTFLDVELATAKNERSWFSGLGQSRTRVIISWHDFNGTPMPSMLAKIVQEARRLDGIPKIVPTARTLDDNLAVLSLYEGMRGSKLKAEDPLIAFCMGEKGIASRILSLTLGSPIAYSSIGESREVAPGQLPLRVMLQIRSMLESGEGRKA